MKRIEPPKPDPAHFNRKRSDGEAAYQAARAQYRVALAYFEELNSNACVTETTLDMQEQASGQKIPAEERERALGYAKAAKDYDELPWLRRPKAPEPIPGELAAREKAEAARAKGRVRDRARRAAKKATGTPDLREHLRQTRRNLANVLESIAKHERHVDAIRAAKARERAGGVLDHDAILLAATFEDRPLDELRLLRPKVAKWQAEIARLEAEIAAKKAPKET